MYRNYPGTLQQQLTTIGKNTALLDEQIRAYHRGPRIITAQHTDTFSSLTGHYTGNHLLFPPADLTSAEKTQLIENLLLRTASPAPVGRHGRRHPYPHSSPGTPGCAEGPGTADSHRRGTPHRPRGHGVVS